MAKIFQNVEIPVDSDLEEKLQWMMPEHGPYRILRQSVDARRSHSPHFVYSIEVAEKGETLEIPQFDLEKFPSQRKALNYRNRPCGFVCSPAFCRTRSSLHFI